MNKSSFLNGLLNEKQKNTADYLATWDNLNVFWKSLGKAWDFVSGFWSSDKELEQADKDSYIEKVDSYIRNHKKPKFKLHASLYKRLTELFDIECDKISSQKELDEYFLKLENEAISFQREFSFKEEKMKPFYGNSFYELRIYFLDVMVKQFKGLENEKQEKILRDMVDKLHTLSAEELENFKEKMNINEVTNESVRKILLGSGIYSLFAGTVSIVGFPAYLFLTSFIGGTSSFIGITLPFGIYTGATSTMAFLTAWFVPILLVGGIFFERKYTNKLRKIFAVGMMVSISFQSYKDTSLEDSNDFIKTFNQLNKNDSFADE